MLGCALAPAVAIYIMYFFSRVIATTNSVCMTSTVIIKQVVIQLFHVLEMSSM